MLKPTVIAIPFFAILIGVEAYFIYRNSREDYDRLDTWVNIALGFGSVAFGAVFGIIQAFSYDSLYSLAFFQIPMDTWWSWVLLLIADDFAYYWFHRISHESRFFWNFHVVHHSSNRYNLSVAVRQSWFGGLAHWLFYVPLGFLGFPLWAFALMHGFNLIYQFWIHTEFIRRLGPLELIFNTPSHHRVHHGVNRQYLDKNYGGIFIFWDRWFGTFENEEEPVVYGIIKPIDSYNWLWINLHSWVETWAAMKTKKTYYGKLRCFFGAPAMDFQEKVLLTSNSITKI